MKKEKKCKRKNIKSVLGGIVIGIALFIVCLFLVQIPYWVGTFWSPIKSDLTPSDILGFLGDFLSAAGTVVLGIIAVKQTERANNISDRVLQLEEKIYDEAHKPKLAIGNTKLYSPDYYNTAMNKEYNGKLYWVESTKKKNLKAEDGFIEFVLTNRGSSGLYGCKLVSIRSTPDELKSHIYNIGDSKATPFDLAPDKSINICLKLYTESIDCFAKKKIESVEICWECENNIGERYIVTGIINGDIVYDGPRYDEVLTPTFHAIKVYWKTQKEVID